MPGQRSLCLLTISSSLETPGKTENTVMDAYIPTHGLQSYFVGKKINRLLAMQGHE